MLHWLHFCNFYQSFKDMTQRMYTSITSIRTWDMLYLSSCEYSFLLWYCSMALFSTLWSCIQAIISKITQWACLVMSIKTFKLVLTKSLFNLKAEEILLTWCMVYSTSTWSLLAAICCLLSFVPWSTLRSTKMTSKIISAKLLKRQYVQNVDIIIFRTKRSKNNFKSTFIHLKYLLT